METTHDAHWIRHRRRARGRAHWHARMADEVLRFVLVTLLLLILVRPIGVIVGLVWGFGIARRLVHGELEPRLVRGELRRCRHEGCAQTRERTEREGEPSALAEQMGDDPAAGRALDWARTALEELSEGEGAASPPGRRDRVRVSDLVEDVVDAAEPRAERHGLRVRMEIDAEGVVETDAARLKAVLLELVGESIRALRRGALGPGLVSVQMGEDLSGSEVWVRIRDDRRDGAAGARGVYGSRPVAGLPGATLETQASPKNGVERILTLPKHAKPSDRSAAPGSGDGAAA